MSSELNPLEQRERQVIEAGTEVLGGILQTRVGVVVDTDENPAVYQTVLNNIDRKLSDRVEVSTPIILKAVKAEADSRIDHYPRGYARILQHEAELRSVERLKPTHEIGLSRFVQLGVGICQQHSLLSATMLRMLQERGDLGGTVSVESGRPNRWHPDRHTTVAFNEDGENFILDAAGGVQSDMRTLAFIW